MAKGRILLKSVSTSKKLANLKSDSTRLLWSWILPHLDCEGRFYAESSVVKGHAVPRLQKHTEATIERDLQELHKAGLIILYEVGGDRYLQFTQFIENQPGLRKDREAESQLPAPPEFIRSKSGVSPELVSDNRSCHYKDKDKDKDKLQDKDEDKDRAEFSGEDIRLVQLLIDLMLKNDPKSSIIKRLTTARQSEWIRSCRLLREADGKTPAEIEQVIAFSQADEFWKSNILSMPKLREKWDQLWLKARRGDNLDGIRDWLVQKEREHADKR